MFVHRRGGAHSILCIFSIFRGFIANFSVLYLRRTRNKFVLFFIFIPRLASMGVGRKVTQFGALSLPAREARRSFFF